MLDDLFMSVLDMSKDAGVVVLVVLLARVILHRAPKVFSYLLWGIVLFRLLCPVSLESAWSLLPDFSPVSESYDLADAPVNVLGAGEAAYRAVGDAINGGLGIQHIRTTQVGESGNRIYVSADWWDVWILFGQYVWMIGLAGMILYLLYACGMLRKKLANAVWLQDNIYRLNTISTPFVWGWLRPRIYLPEGLGEREEQYIICHEQYHIKRGDHIVKMVAYLTLCIHWFNPLVWIAFKAAIKDMEMSCDEAVVKKLGGEIRADYAASLLSLATGRLSAGFPPAFGEGDTKGRIKNLANWKKPAKWMVIVSVMLCVVLALCLLTNPRTGQEQAGVTQEMVPTEADLEGVFGDYLYVPLEGHTYRYQQAYVSMDTVKRGKLLYEFTERPDFSDESLEWKVYTIDGEDDLSRLYAMTKDFECVYQYSPSKRSPEGALEEAKASGCVVMEDGDVTTGVQIWQDFLERVESGQKAQVQVAYYYTLDPENCDERYYEAYREDYPVLYSKSLFYDGEGYILRWQEGNTQYEQTYQYLMHYTGEAETFSARYDSYDRYVLTHDNTVTWEDLMWGMASSQLGDYIDHDTVYTDLE